MAKKEKNENKEKEKKEEKKDKKEILVIVAHPDDETIWVGGTLLKHKEKGDSNVTIISLCRKNDADRAPKFKRACEILGAEKENCHISDLDDLEKGHFKKISIQEIINRILDITKDKEYDILYTHGENGEYKHRRHINVHNAVNEMLKKKSLSAKEVFYFSCRKRQNDFQGYAIYNSNADKLIRLEKPYLKMKKKLIQEIYGYQKGGFEEQSCKGIESFDFRK
jgi:LmbE family N-acetylglucosaminyl deacetylase